MQIDMEQHKTSASSAAFLSPQYFITIIITGIRHIRRHTIGFTNRDDTQTVADCG